MVSDSGFILCWKWPRADDIHYMDHAMVHYRPVIRDSENQTRQPANEDILAQADVTKEERGHRLGDGPPGVISPRQRSRCNQLMNERKTNDKMIDPELLTVTVLQDKPRVSRSSFWEVAVTEHDQPPSRFECLKSSWVV